MCMRACVRACVRACMFYSNVILLVQYEECWYQNCYTIPVLDIGHVLFFVVVLSCYSSLEIILVVESCYC